MKQVNKAKNPNNNKQTNKKQQEYRQLNDDKKRTRAII
jgi:hypothetical protein